MIFNGKNFGRFDTSLAFPGIRWQFDRKTILMSLHNIAAAGHFAADRSIKEYADRIWNLKRLTGVK